MAVILYPETDWDAFIDVATCDAFLTANVIGTQRTAYDALTDPDKEIYIRQATTLIRGKITLPATLEDDLMYATAYLVNYSIGVDMTRDDGKGNLKSINIVNETVEKEWFSPTDANNDFPDIVQSLLSAYGLNTDGSFSFIRS